MTLTPAAAVIVLEGDRPAARYRLDGREAARRYAEQLADRLPRDRFHVLAVARYVAPAQPLETPPAPAEAAARLLRRPS